MLFAAVVGAAMIGSEPSATAGQRYRRTTRSIAPGVTYMRIVDTRGPNRLRVLKIDPSRAVTIDVALARERIPGHERPSSMAERHGAIAAINGDYTIKPSHAGAGRPVDTFIEDGRLTASPLIWGRNFAITRDERDVFIGHRDLKVSLVQHDSARKWRIVAWNELDHAPDGISAHTAKGGNTYRPPRNACSARLDPTGRTAWSPSRSGLERDYEVQARRCSADRLPRKGGIVVSAPRSSAAAKRIREQLEPGETVTLSWSMNWRGVMDTIGGNPDLVQEGRVVVEPCSGSYFCDRNPRTGIGVTSEGKLLLATVDGRQPRYSVGMTPVEFARAFRYLGATAALNLDGGGSTAMVINGRIVNRPSDGWERPVGSAVLVLPGRDRGETKPATTWSAGSSETVDNESPLSLARLPAPAPITPIRVDPACLALQDAGSTGGMLDAYARGLLDDHRRRLPPAVTRAVGVFRGSRGC